MNEEELAALRRAGAIAREARDLGASMIGEGVSLSRSRRRSNRGSSPLGARPAFLQHQHKRGRGALHSSDGDKMSSPTATLSVFDGRTSTGSSATPR